MIIPNEMIDKLDQDNSSAAIPATQPRFVKRRCEKSCISKSRLASGQRECVTGEHTIGASDGRMRARRLIPRASQLASNIQHSGVIARISNMEGIVVQSEDNSEFALPPDLNALQPAPPGEYREHSSGRVIENPDFITMWEIIQSSTDQGSGTDWKRGPEIKFPDISDGAI
jgi:hypothetical protein